VRDMAYETLTYLSQIIQLSLDYKTSALVAERDSDGMLPIDLANQCGRDECAGLLAQIWKGLLMPGETEDKLVRTDWSHYSRHTCITSLIGL
jgi:hypothetical protein